MTKKLFISLIIFIAFGSCGKSQEKDYGYVVKTEQKAPQFQVELIDGTIFSNKNLKGKVTMLQFTASWCSVCRKEMPHIEKRIWQVYKNNPNFQLIGIDYDEPKEKVITFKNATQITYPLALDPKGKAFHQFAAKGAGVTRNIIIDKTGKIVFLTRLFKEQEFNKMIGKIDSLLKE